MPHHRIDGHGCEITGNPDPGHAVRAAWGSVNVGSNHATLDLRSVGLENLFDVQSLTVNRIAHSTSHGPYRAL